MDEVKWEDPPPARRGHDQGGVWISLLLPLMDHPKRWACLGKFPRGAAGALKGKVRKPPGEWEFASRSINTEGEKAERPDAWLYARYMGTSE